MLCVCKAHVVLSNPFVDNIEQLFFSWPPSQCCHLLCYLVFKNVFLNSIYFTWRSSCKWLLRSCESPTVPAGRLRLMLLYIPNVDTHLSENFHEIQFNFPSYFASEMCTCTLHIQLYFLHRKCDKSSKVIIHSDHWINDQAKNWITEWLLFFCPVELQFKNRVHISEWLWINGALKHLWVSLKCSYWQMHCWEKMKDS